jgi:phage gp45-like
MHRATPLNSSFRAYSGGARSVIPQVDDSKFMQESTNSQGMASEKIPTMEAPQNYGFTSVVADADKSGNPGEITASAEGFISFMGGNRSFPVMGIMDDRRHRLLNLGQDAAKGASAMFGLKDWGQQLLNTKDGWFMSGNTKKKIRIQLVDNKNQQQQGGGSGGSSGGQSVSELAAGGGGAGGAGGGQQKGQKTLHKEQSETFIDMLGSSQQDSEGGGGGGGAGASASDSGGGSQEEHVITIQAKKKIILKVGQSTITIIDGEIELKSPKIITVGDTYLGSRDASQPVVCDPTCSHKADTGGKKVVVVPGSACG